MYLSSSSAYPPVQFDASVRCDANVFSCSYEANDANQTSNATFVARNNETEILKQLLFLSRGNQTSETYTVSVCVRESKQCCMYEAPVLLERFRLLHC